MSELMKAEKTRGKTGAKNGNRKKPACVSGEEKVTHRTLVVVLK